MKKTINEGFVLLETLVVTVFISGVLIFLFSQLSALKGKYEKSYIYNSVDDIYALANIAAYIKDDWDLYNKIDTNMEEYINITDCSLFTNLEFCKKLLEYEEIEELLVAKNKFNKSSIFNSDDSLLDFINEIHPRGNEKYRLIAKFKHKVKVNISSQEKQYEYNTFATIRFGENNE